MRYNTYTCPICGKHRFTEDGDYSICPHCGWENDSVMNADPSFWGGANKLCQLDFKLRYLYYVSHNPKYHWAHDDFPQVPQIEEMDCPVCKKMKFVPLTWDELYCGVTPADIHCQYCGWKYDLAQIESPKLKNRANEMSLIEYREWYEKKIAENPNYVYFDEVTDQYIPTPHKCPVCGKYEFEDDSCHDICPFCGWEDDGVQLNDQDFSGGANILSLKQYRKEYKKRLQLDPNYRWDKNKK